VLLFLDLRLGCANWSVFVKSFFSVPDGSIERKGGYENRNAVWKTEN